MNSTRSIIAALFAIALVTSVAAASKCHGSAKYKVIFYNGLSETSRFRRIVPRGGLHFSPLTGVTHDPRVSLFTIRGYASKGLQMICETGANRMFMREAKDYGNRVTSVVGGKGGIDGDMAGSIIVEATCKNSYLTVTSMIAPSPDWIVQINNMPLLEHGKFIPKAWGRLFAYDCGTDSSRDFTDPSNLSLDKPTVPKDNIVRLAEDETDRFDGYPVGFYKVIRMK